LIHLEREYSKRIKITNDTLKQYPNKQYKSEIKTQGQCRAINY